VRNSGVDELKLVVNASPLIFLAQIDSLSVLSQLARAAIIPASVQSEIRVARKRHPTFKEVELPDWIQVEPDLPIPNAIAGWDLGAGESQVLARTLLLPDSEAVLDDLQARHCSRAIGVPVTGTLGILLRAKRRGIIPAVRPLVEELIQKRMYLSRELVETALADVGE
jgi:predicted nucleic acid-binding protein